MSEFDVLDLNQIAVRQIQHADKLRTVSQRFHGYEDPETGEKHAGVKLQFEEALNEALLAIAEPYLDDGKRPPAEDIRKAMALRRVKAKLPDLYDEYHALEATISRITRWLGDARNASITRQSVVKTERELAGRLPEQRGGEVYGRRAR